MDDSPESFAYRCLPLSTANSHGWEILNPCACEVVWNGGPAAEDVVVTPDPGSSLRAVPVALVGLGTVTFHVEGISRTQPGWNLWAGGPPNVAKDGAGPLSGVIETDWSPFTFTMNWKLTRPHHPVRFELDEPICFVFSVGRRTQQSFTPIADDPALKASFEAWSQSRDPPGPHARPSARQPGRKMAEVAIIGALTLRGIVPSAITSRNCGRRRSRARSLSRPRRRPLNPKRKPRSIHAWRRLTPLPFCLAPQTALAPSL